MSWLLPRKVAKNDKWQKNIQALLHVTYLFLGGSRKKSAHFATPTGGHAQFCSQVFCYMFPPNRQQIRKQWKVWNQTDWVQARSHQNAAQLNSSSRRSLVTSRELSILIIMLPPSSVTWPGDRSRSDMNKDVNASRRSEEPQVYPVYWFVCCENSFTKILIIWHDLYCGFCLFVYS